MQVSVETTSSLGRRLTIGVPSDRIESEVEARLKKASATVMISGFRPGKVPMKVLRQRFGMGIRQEVLGDVISESFREAITQENLKPVSQPTIEPKTNELGRDLEFIATFEVFPEVELADFTQISIEKPTVELQETDLDAVIENLQKQYASWEEAARPAQKGDRVVVDFKGTKDGEVFEGGSAEGSSLILGSGRMIPGFEEGLEGMAAGDTKVLDLKFPDDYHKEDLKGTAVVFEVTAHQVFEQRLAELNEDFFTQFGVTEGGEAEFRNQVSENMQRELNRAIKDKVKKRLFEQLAKTNEVEIPRALIKSEISVLRNQLLQRFESPKSFDPSMLPDELFEDQATHRVKLALLLGEIIKQAAIEVDYERVGALIDELVSTYEDPEAVRKWYYGNSDQMVMVESAVLEEQVVEKMLESAQVREIPCTYMEAVTADPEPPRKPKAE